MFFSCWSGRAQTVKVLGRVGKEKSKLNPGWSVELVGVGDFAEI